MTRVFRIIVGLVFLLSALFKAADAATFANLIGQYGSEWFGFAAPGVILIEIVLSLLLLFDIRPQLSSIVTLFFVLGVSAIYLYGLTRLGITNCGCFGALHWLNTHPWLTFVRNTILILLLLPSIIRKQQGTQLGHWAGVSIGVIIVIAMFACGYSFSDAKCLRHSRPFQPIPLNDSPLSDYIECHPDSTYLIFAFSYGCPYCQNSVGNVEQYATMGVVDKVVGVAVSDSTGRERFHRLFDVDFEIREITASQMVRINRTLPATYLIRHDSIIRRHVGMVSSPALSLP